MPIHSTQYCMCWTCLWQHYSPLETEHRLFSHYLLLVLDWVGDTSLPIYMRKQHLQQVWGMSYVMVTTRDTDEHTSEWALTWLYKWSITCLKASRACIGHGLGFFAQHYSTEAVIPPLKLVTGNPQTRSWMPTVASLAKWLRGIIWSCSWCFSRGWRSGMGTTRINTNALQSQRVVRVRHFITLLKPTLVTLDVSRCEAWSLLHIVWWWCNGLQLFVSLLPSYKKRSAQVITWCLYTVQAKDSKFVVSSTTCFSFVFFAASCAALSCHFNYPLSPAFPPASSSSPQPFPPKPYCTAHTCTLWVVTCPSLCWRCWVSQKCYHYPLSLYNILLWIECLQPQCIPG